MALSSNNALVAKAGQAKPQGQAPTPKAPAPKRTKGPQVPAIPPLPTLPVGNDRHQAQATRVVQDLVPWVEYKLAEALVKMGFYDEAPALAELEPLSIKDRDVAGGGVASFKEKWCPRNCATAARASGLYEAAGSLFWVPAGARAQEVLPVQDCTWAQVEELKPLFEEAQELARVVFPATLSAWVEDISVLYPPGAGEGDCMPKALTLVENHALVVAWWLAMFEALRAENQDRVRLLYECALTVTIRLYVGTSKQALALMLWQATDKKKQVLAVADDNVITFAKKFQIIVENCGVKGIGKQLEHWKAIGLNFMGKPVYRMLHYALLAIAQLSDKAQALLQELESKAGRAFLTEGHSKLHNVMRRAGAGADNSEAIDPVEQLLHLLLVEVDGEKLQAQDATSDFFEGGRGAGAGVGWVAMSLCKLAVLGKVCGVLSTSEEAWASNALQQINDLGKARQALAKAAEAESVKVSEDGLWSAVFSSKDAVPPGYAADFIAYVSNLLGGGYDADLKTFNDKEDLVAQLLAGEGDNPVLKDWREALDTLDRGVSGLSTGVVAVDSIQEDSLASAPLSLLMQKCAAGDDLEEVRETTRRERAEVLAKARGLRKGLCQLLVLPQACTKEALQSALARAGAGGAGNFHGKLNEKHRGYFLMADLEHEEKQGWAQVSEMSGSVKQRFSQKCAFLKGLAGSCDFVFVGDGRCRAARATIEEALVKDLDYTQFFELWVSFAGPCVRASTRQVVGGQVNKEIIFVKLPAPRVRLAAVDDFVSKSSGAGAKVTTADTNYVNVPFLASAKLPKLAWADKAEILGMKADAAPADRAPDAWADGEGASAGVPLFWQESKGVAVWQALVKNHMVKDVVDLSPGSGALASACLSMGIRYTGFCGNEKHRKWLENLVDRQALALAATEGHALWTQSLADLIQLHFKDVVAGDGGDGGGDDGDEEGENEEDGEEDEVPLMDAE
ncbi:unnamed protein product [Symbiodinium sp. CCMP2592]|nr:unnamed protein product [Symbiodinium sp. CCMP2592]